MLLDFVKTAKNALDYDPETGVFTHKDSGKVAGTDCHGYWKLKISQRQVLAHRMAWAMHYGEEPPAEIDHIDGDKTNNAISNLRDGTKGVNTMNRGMHREGLVGVKHYKGKWAARMGKAGRFLYNGPDFFEAVCARKSAENRFWAAA